MVRKALILSNTTGVLNVNTVPYVPKMTNNDASVPKPLNVTMVYCTNRCSKRQVYQSAPDVPKLTSVPNAVCSRYQTYRLHQLYQKSPRTILV